HYRCLKGGADPGQRMFDECSMLAFERLLIRRQSTVGRVLKRIAAFGLAVGHRDLMAAMPRKPAPMIVGFVHRDPINPGTQAALLPERRHATKDFQKNFLYDIRGVRLI